MVILVTLVTYYVKRLCTIHSKNKTSFLFCLYRASWNNYATYINEMHTLQMNALIRFLTSSTCFKTRGFIIRQTVCTSSLYMVFFSYISASSLAGGTACSHTIFHMLDCLCITTSVVINNVYSCILNYECYVRRFIYVYWFWYFGILTFYVFVFCVLATCGWPQKLVIVCVTIFYASVCILLIFVSV
jgi:hypothetical protein